MIGLVLIIAAQSAAASPGIVIPDPIAPAWERYFGCTNERTHVDLAGDTQSLRKSIQAGIDACRSVKEAAKHEADRKLALAPDYQDATKRRRVIDAAFDGLDREQLNVTGDRSSE